MLLKSSRYVSINISMTVDMFPQTRVTQKKEKCDKEDKESPFTKENEEVLGPFVFHS